MPFVSAADAGNDLIVQHPFCFALGDMTELTKLLQTDKPVDKYEPIVFFSRHGSTTLKKFSNGRWLRLPLFLPFFSRRVKKSVIFGLPRGKFCGFIFFRDLRNEILLNSVKSMGRGILQSGSKCGKNTSSGVNLK